MFPLHIRLEEFYLEIRKSWWNTEPYQVSRITPPSRSYTKWYFGREQAASQLLTLCLTSTDPKFDEIYLSNFATLNVLDLIRRIPGVGRVSNIGSRYYAMQIWVQPDKLANFGLTVADLQNALKDQNRESAAGVLGQQPVQGLDVTIPITTQGRLSTVSQFEEIVVRANADGSIIRLRDVARISLEAPIIQYRECHQQRKCSGIGHLYSYQEPTLWK